MCRRTAVRIAAALGACVTAGMTAPAVSAQDRHVAFVRVLDLAGQPVTDLAADDFVVSEDGRRARVVSATAGTEPMRVALLIDNGESVRGGQAVIALRNAVAAFPGALPPEHSVGLFTIGGAHAANGRLHHGSCAAGGGGAIPLLQSGGRGSPCGWDPGDVGAALHR